jgi:hypothetical protein
MKCKIFSVVLEIFSSGIWISNPYPLFSFRISKDNWRIEFIKHLVFNLYILVPAKTVKQNIKIQNELTGDIRLNR